MDRTCPKCQKPFTKPSLLKQHPGRKTPCAPIIDRAELSEKARAKAHSCKYCGRTFTTPQGLSRHVRHNRRIAGSDEGMEKPVEHTLQRQLAEQAAKVDALQSQMSEPTSLPSTQLTLAPSQNGPVSNGTPPSVVVTGAAQVNLGPRSGAAHETRAIKPPAAGSIREQTGGPSAPAASADHRRQTARTAGRYRRSRARSTARSSSGIESVWRAAAHV